MIGLVTIDYVKLTSVPFLLKILLKFYEKINTSIYTEKKKTLYN